MNRRELLAFASVVGMVPAARAFAATGDLRSTAREAYIYGLPLSEMAAARQRMLHPTTGAAGQPVFKVASTILRQEGVRAFYQGWTAAVARAFPANAALLLGFELSHRLFRMDD